MIAVPDTEDQANDAFAGVHPAHTTRDLLTSAQALKSLFGVAGTAELDDATLDRLRQAVTEPLLDIIERGGKGWRSQIIVHVCDALGGDSASLHSVVGIIELLHVGSLIIDDVQDESLERRGGPCCHIKHGTPLAINAGNFAYFLFDRLVSASPVGPERKVELYDLFFQCLRNAHAGQGLDLMGVGDLARYAADSGDADALLRAIRTTHTLKTGAAVVLGTQIGAIVAGDQVSRQQRDLLSRFGAALGIGFQISDDVLGIRGGTRRLKTPGEDIANGTITYPVAIALSRLPRQQRLELLHRIEGRNSSDENMEAVSGLLESAQACETSMQQAAGLLEKSWSDLAPLLPDRAAASALHDYALRLIWRHY